MRHSLMENSNHNNCKKKAKHLLTPADAILALRRLLLELPGLNQAHLAYALGVSPGQLSKELYHLSQCALGNEEACKKYNSRSKFMRLLYVLDMWTPTLRKEYMRDAYINAASNSQSSWTVGVSKEDLSKFSSEVSFLLDEGIVFRGQAFKLKTNTEEV